MNTWDSLSRQVKDKSTGAVKGTDTRPVRDVYAQGMMAPQYSALTFPVAAGAHCIYEGELYAAKQAIAASEAWTAAHWDKVQLGAEVAKVGASVADLKSQVNDLQTDVDILVKNAIDSPDVLQKVVAAGRISNYLDIGDVIIIPWTDNGGNTPVTYQYPFVVVYIGDAYDENDVKHENALWLMAMYGTPRDIIFDAAERAPVDLTEEPNALEGWYYWGVDGSTYTELHLSTGDPIPTTYASVAKCGINNVSVLRYGYNRWRDSAYRQWLNSDAEKNEGWWTEQHMGDRPPSDAQNNLPGWLNGFTEEWRAIFKPVKVDTACNTVTDGGVTDTTYDTFFLPSVEQMYGAPQAAGVEGEYWPYWKEETGLDAPSNGSGSDTNDARKIPSIANPTGSAVYCRLRSANRGYSTSVWSVYAAGYLNTNAAYDSYRALPACVIY